MARVSDGAWSIARGDSLVAVGRPDVPWRDRRFRARLTAPATGGSVARLTAPRAVSSWAAPSCSGSDWSS